MKTFKFSLTEQNGEQEYGYNYLVYAGDEEEADKIMKEFAQQWYDDPDVVYDADNDRWEFFGGCIHVTINNDGEITPKDFAKELLNRYSIGIPE